MLLSCSDNKRDNFQPALRRVAQLMDLAELDQLEGRPDNIRQWLWKVFFIGVERILVSLSPFCQWLLGWNLNSLGGCLKGSKNKLIAMRNTDTI